MGHGFIVELNEHLFPTWVSLLKKSWGKGENKKKEKIRGKEGGNKGEERKI